MDVVNHHVVFERDDPKKVDIHRIIDEAMEKKDREVVVYINDIGTTVKVLPLSDAPMWIEEVTKYPSNNPQLADIVSIGYRCSECTRLEKFPGIYCPNCGEKMKGVKKLEVKDEHK